MEQEQQVSTGFIATTPAPAEKPPVLKHRGSLTSLRAITANSGSRGIEVNVVSEGNGRSYKKVLWVPKEWADNVFITGDELSKLPVPEGKKQTPYQRFGRVIANSGGNGELQQILIAGQHVGRAPEMTYTDFETLVETANTALAGIPILFTTGADGEADPEFGYSVRVKTIRPFDANYDKLAGISADGQ